MKIRYYAYELLSTSFGIGTLCLFGSLSFFPIEVTLMGDGQTWFWVPVIFSLSVIAAFFLLSFYKRESSLIITRIFEALSTLTSILTIFAFLTFTQDLQEPWIMQGAWFFRYNGIIMGIFIGFVLIKTVAGLSFIISKLNEPEEVKKNDEKEPNERLKENITLILIVATFSFYIVEILLYRYISLYGALLSIFIFQIGLSISSIYLFNRPDYQELTQLKNLKIDEEIEEKLNQDDNADLNTQKSEIKDKMSRIKRFNLNLEDTGLKKEEFWSLLLPLIIVGSLAIICIIIYPLSLPMKVEFLVGNTLVGAILPVFQILSLAAIIILFFSFLFNIFGSISRRKFGVFYSKGKISYFKLSVYGFFEAMKVLGLWLVIGLILYFYDYPIYYPRVVSFYLIFGIIGAIIYWYMGKSTTLKRILYSWAIIMLVLNFLWIYSDGLSNATTIYYSANFDIIYPFKYLHNWPNYVLTGIPLGIIVSDFLLGFLFKNTDGTDSTNRALFIVISCFVGGLMMFPGYFLVNNPGGDVPLTDLSNSVFAIVCMALVFILLTGLLFHWILEYYLPKYFEKSRGAVKKTVKRLRNKHEHDTYRDAYKKEAIALIFITILANCLIGVFTISYTYQRTNSRPLVAHSAGNYYVWIQNSSERVQKNYIISAETSPILDEVELKLAKNEYGAFQLVWRPIGKVIESLSYNISDFIHDEIPNRRIKNDYCELRYINYVLEDEFPDVLIPFTTLDLTKNENYILWFSIKTPYDAQAGNYSGQINFGFNNGESLSVKIKLIIWNFAIPKTRHMSTNIGVSSDRSLTLIDNFQNHRINDYGIIIRYTDNLTLLQTKELYTCYLDKTANQWTFNWTWWDNFTQYKLNRGTNAFRVNCPLGIADGRTPYIHNETRMNWLKSFFAGVEEHLEEKGWLDYAFIYFIDEFSFIIPSQYNTRMDYFKDIKVLLKALKECAPKIKIMTTTAPTEELELVRNYIDIYCPITYDRDKEKWDERLDAGTEFWMYACVGPMGPWPNSHLYNRLYECRVLIWQVWLYKIQGFLYWQSMAYYHGQYGLAYNGWGDGWFIYLDNGQYFDTPRWENYLEGMEDYEYLWLLNATLNHLEDNPGLVSSAKLRSYRAELDGIVDSIVGEKWVYCDNPSTIYNGRERIGIILDELCSIVDMTIVAEAPWYPPYKPSQ